MKPTTKTVKVWKEDADPTLQEQFQHTDWKGFFADAIKDSHTNIHTVAKSVMDNLNVCAEGVTTHKTVKLFPNQKPWMNKEVCLQLKARDAAFRSGDQEAYSSTRANLRNGISRAKHNYKQRIEEHLNSSDPRRKWQGLHTLTNKSSCNSPPPSSTSLPDELNHFYAHLDRENKDAAFKSAVSTDEDTLQLSTSEVCDILTRVNARKAAGPDGVPGHVLQACTEQFAGVFTDIFNISLAQSQNVFNSWSSHI